VSSHKKLVIKRLVDYFVKFVTVFLNCNQSIKGEYGLRWLWHIFLYLENVIQSQSIIRTHLTKLCGGDGFVLGIICGRILLIDILPVHVRPR